MNYEEREKLISECQKRWNYNSKYLPFYILEALKYQEKKEKNFILFEEYCIQNNCNPDDNEARLKYSEENLGIASTFLPSYCFFESMCNAKGFDIYETTKSNKIKNLFKRK